ncbi:MAG: hypothetical protein QGI52_00125, partial [Alphaproteobacteria bacterium]|nr:hypothetical protein [Alphaproteobacteria bacterium]
MHALFVMYAVGVDNNCGRYLYLKQGVYYFSRHVPVDVRQHHECSRIVICLKTKSIDAADRAATAIAHKLDDYWLGLRLQRLPISMAHRPALQPDVNDPAAPAL